MTEKKRSDVAWIAGALIIVGLVGLLIMLCGISLSLGYHRLSVLSFFGVIVLLGLIVMIRKNHPIHPVRWNRHRQEPVSPDPDAEGRQPKERRS